ncbi:cation:proton antiporter [Pedobacter sp. ASV12]|uniref:cation:proton antiporter n=1 Tax=Pedobacter sp. ASV12 TaxID=2795120 RepID=UPI0018EE0334|nr:sodium:proton antiporter [Pedobacter sp. ASV12]
MDIYTYLVILIGLSATFSFINQRWIKLPFVIGLFLLSSIVSIAILSLRFWMELPFDRLHDLIENAHIEKIIIDVLLGFLLFAGALHTDWSKLKLQIRSISVFALPGVIFSTLIIAALFYGAACLLGLEVTFIYCLLFGALISPTDPIAVLGILTKAGVPQKTETTIVGESLFNDGVGVVLFVALLELVRSGNTTFDFSSFGLLFLQEAVGGITVGLVFGYLLHILLRAIDHYETEVLLTLAFVMGGYSLFNYVHISGALAMVVMGLMVGNFKQDIAMSNTTQEYVHKFWELVDVVLNAILFILIAFVILLVEFKKEYIILGGLAILIVLLSRFIIVYFPQMLMGRFLDIDRKAAKIIWWGGLRGGLSLALVLSLPASETKDLLLVVTYLVVVFSILIQGLTIGKVAKGAANA